MTQPVRRTEEVMYQKLAHDWIQLKPEHKRGSSHKLQSVRNMDRGAFPMVAYLPPVALHEPREASVHFSMTQLFLNMSATSFM